MHKFKTLRSLGTLARATKHEPRTPSLLYAWYAIGTLTLVNIFNYVDRSAFQILLPAIQRDIGLSDAQIGVVSGLAFSIAYALFALPIARMADRGVRRNILAALLSSWSVMTAMCGGAQNFWHILLTRIGVGASESGGQPISNSLICDLVPQEQRSKAFAIFLFGTAIGAGVGGYAAGFLGESIGWRLSLVALGLTGLVLAAFIRAFLREPIRGQMDVHASAAAQLPLRASLRLLAHYRVYRFAALYTVSYGFVYSALFSWWPFFFTRVHNLSLPVIGFYIGIVATIGPLLGLIVGGSIGDALAKRNVKLPLLVGAAGSVLSILSWLGALWSASPLASIILISMAGFFLSIAAAPLMATLFGVVDAHARATASAILNIAQAVLGGSLGPLCVGIASDILTPRMGPEALRYAMLVPLAAAPLITIALYGAAQGLPSDLQRRALQ